MHFTLNFISYSHKFCRFYCIHSVLVEVIFPCGWSIKDCLITLYSWLLHGYMLYSMFCRFCTSLQLHCFMHAREMLSRFSAVVRFSLEQQEYVSHNGTDWSDNFSPLDVTCIVIQSIPGEPFPFTDDISSSPLIATHTCIKAYQVTAIR